jgi:CheY-like chemotaxis protein
MPDCARPLVLYVEDDRIQTILMEEAFRHLPGFELRAVETGAEALALLGERRPALALIDMRLPDMSGLELMARLRALPGGAELRCVVLSADDPSDRVRAAREAGFEDYWLKPIDLPRLQAALAQVAVAG